MDGKPQVVKALTLSGKDNMLFRRNSVTGTIEAIPWKGGGIELNVDLHDN
jgi:2,3,4,5-tetrahydropyridine-2-carboxylate N-succinyltransferase